MYDDKIEPIVRIMHKRLTFRSDGTFNKFEANSVVGFVRTQTFTCSRLVFIFNFQNMVLPLETSKTFFK